MKFQVRKCFYGPLQFWTELVLELDDLNEAYRERDALMAADDDPMAMYIVKVVPPAKVEVRAA